MLRQGSEKKHFDFFLYTHTDKIVTLKKKEQPHVLEIDSQRFTSVLCPHIHRLKNNSIKRLCRVSFGNITSFLMLWHRKREWCKYLHQFCVTKNITATPRWSFPNCLCKSSCSVFFAYTLTANIQTNPQHYIYTCQQGAFPFHTAAHKHIEKGKERIHTFSSLLIADDRTRVFGYSPVPQAYCSLFNLRKRIPFHFVLGLD